MGIWRGVNVKVWPQGRPAVVPKIECRYVTVEVDGETWILEVTLDVERAVRQMAWRAVKSKGRKSVDVGGALVVKRHRKIEKKAEGEHAEG